MSVRDSKKVSTENAQAASSSSTESTESKKLLGTLEIPSFARSLLVTLFQCYVFFWSVYNAYRIRTHALTEYGMVIHEFDPWFNFRATQYLAKHGWHAFFHWYDYMSWYPLGRPVGTTIYPGLQITSVTIWRGLKWMAANVDKSWNMTLNDVCCTLPCWFGSLSTIILTLIVYESTGSRNAAVIAGAIFAVIPAHIMRSVGGGYDNECIAIAAMLMTFYFWIRSLRNKSSWPFGLLTGLAYGYMVAAWGGYVFVLNMVALHAAACILFDWSRNHYDPTIMKSYFLFYIVGTYIAVQVPPVGMTPFKSLEQLFALLVFLFSIVLHLSEMARAKLPDVAILSQEGLRLRMKYFFGTCGLLLLVAVALTPTGYFGPLSSRVRGLFVQHTRTGNPLVDSVAEHQPANADAYHHYLYFAFYFWQVGIFLLPLQMKLSKPFHRGASFLFVYGIVAYYFSLKMARLILLSGPVAAACSGMCIAWVGEWILRQVLWGASDDKAVEAATAEVQRRLAPGKGKGNKTASSNSLDAQWNDFQLTYTANRSLRVALALAIVALCLFGNLWGRFLDHSENMAYSFSNPQLMFKTRGPNGESIMIDDYRDAYFWLRDKTPQDSRVMAWWDYGYQITGIGNRTSIADGNTWNHEHIATLGKCLTSPVKEAHSLIRHLADYVLIWAGGNGDDLAKSPHMARIGNSVYRDICKDDPLCTHFGFETQGYDKPTPMMRASLLYHLHAHNQRGVYIDSQLFQEVFTSKYGLVRIFKVMNVSEESKAWVADPSNRKCDAPGSWYCDGQYPPAPEIQALLAKRRDFGQLEDFNRKKKDDDYHRSYMQRMGGRA